MRAGQHRGTVPRRIKRGVGDKSEEKEERGDAHQESDELIEPTVPGGNKYRFQVIHEGRMLRRTLGSARQMARASTLCQEGVVPTMTESSGGVQLVIGANLASIFFDPLVLVGLQFKRVALRTQAQVFPQ